MTYDAKSVETLGGTVSGLGSLDAGGLRFSTLSLKTSGDLLTVVLSPIQRPSGPPPHPPQGSGAPPEDRGPSLAPPSDAPAPPPRGPADGETVPRAPVGVGDAVYVRGARAQYRGEPVFLAAELTARGETLRLRDPATGELLGEGPDGAAGLPGGGGSPPFSRGPAAPDKLHMRIRGAWRLPEEEARAFLGQSPHLPSLEEFAVLSMACRYSGKSFEAVSALRAGQRSWAEVVRQVGGPWADLVFRGDARYPLGPGEGGPSPDLREERVYELATVMTLERITGLSPAALRRELKAGKSLGALLESTVPQGQSPPSQGGTPGRPGGPPGGPSGGGGRM